MNINEKLARWQGLENVRPTRLSNGTIVIIYNSNEIIPDYLNDDAAAMSLLDALAEKGFHPELYHTINDDGAGEWYFQTHPQASWYHVRPTRREAVVEAVLELIGKEGKDGV